MNLHQVVSVPVPCPFYEGQTQVYVLREDPVTLIDTGGGSPDAYDALVHGLARQKLSISDIERVVLTHKHIDHVGNAWRIQAESHAEVAIHQADLPAVLDADRDGSRFLQLVARRLDQWEVPAEVRPGPATGEGLRGWQIESVDARPLQDGEQLTTSGNGLQVIHTPGHTIGSICLRYNECLFSGDHVLPDISPNVGVDVEHRDMLKLYLESLERMEHLEGAVRALPGHGLPFDRLRARCVELRQHHQARLARILDILGEGPASTYEIAQGLFGDMHGFHVFLGCAEADTHLQYLAGQDLAVCGEGSSWSRV